MNVWPQLRDQLDRAMSLDVEWTVDEDQAYTWWGWYLPQRVEYLDEPDGDPRYIVGRVRISTYVGNVAPDARVPVASFLSDWNQDATGAIGLMNPDTGDVFVGVAIPVTDTNLPLVIRMAAGFAPRQAAYAVKLGSFLHQNLGDDGLFVTGWQPHPQFGIRQQPDELVANYIDGARDGLNLDNYDQFAVHEQLAAQLMTELPVEPGYTNLDAGIRTFQLKDDQNEFFSYRYAQEQPGGLLQTGPMLVVRAFSGSAALIESDNLDLDVMTSVYLTHANWHAWNEPRLPLLGAWLPGQPIGNDALASHVIASLPAAAFPDGPEPFDEQRASILRNVLTYVFHQANVGAPLTYRVFY